MKKPSALIFVHGGDGYDTYQEYLAGIVSCQWVIAPYSGEKKRWKTRIFDALLQKGTLAYSPEFPCKNNAKYHEWKLVFELLMVNIDNDAVYIGHSLGGNFLSKYFLETGKRVRELHLVAPSYGSAGGFELLEDLSALHNTIETIHLWYSLDDKVVDPKEFELYKTSLPGVIVHEFSDRGHFNQETFPEIEASITNTFLK